MGWGLDAHMNFAVSTTRINVLSSSCFSRAKVTSNERSQHIMASVLHNAAVLWVSLVFRFRINSASVGDDKIPRLIECT
jgi:hypothetical protein